MYTVTINHRSIECDIYGLRYYISVQKELNINIEGSALTHDDFEHAYPNARVFDLQNRLGESSGYIIDMERPIIYQCNTQEVKHITRIECKKMLKSEVKERRNL